MNSTAMNPMKVELGKLVAYRLKCKQFKESLLLSSTLQSAVVYEVASHTDIRGFEPQCGGRLSSLNC